MTGLFDAGPQIVARIQERVSGLTTVALASSLAAVQDVAPLCPAVFVEPDGADIQSLSEDEYALSVEHQQWRIVVCVTPLTDGTETPEGLAGPYLMSIYQALQGWRPLPELGRLRYALREKAYLEIGYGEFPVIYKTPVPVSAE